jgi:hypothetical protein
MNVINHRGWQIRIFPPSQMMKEYAAFIDRPILEGFECFCGLWRKTEALATKSAKETVDFWLEG